VLTALTKTIIIIISHIFISDVFSKGKNPLTLILILVLTFNKRRCAKTKTKNDYIDIKIRSQIGLCSRPINTLHNNIWTATFFSNPTDTILKSLLNLSIAVNCKKPIFQKSCCYVCEASILEILTKIFILYSSTLKCMYALYLSGCDNNSRCKKPNFTQ
jgi:hypothetical protein